MGPSPRPARRSRHVIGGVVISTHLAYASRQPIAARVPHWFVKRALWAVGAGSAGSREEGICRRAAAGRAIYRTSSQSSVPPAAGGGVPRATLNPLVPFAVTAVVVAQEHVTLAA
jgi:hypothetical protein